jgi:hypothetical protein
LRWTGGPEELANRSVSWSMGAFKTETHQSSTSVADNGDRWRGSTTRAAKCTWGLVLNAERLHIELDDEKTESSTTR